ncbi:glycoside hydrolase family 16 protein [Wenyingzhuangia sp. chi5]|uniref:Glycoside hydrolase family 16 protein n=1 Tax=Wenyingzhuangia gilva TaxID=3057677 RepID=A0ABT8VT67_9FLAO|nr:glycoside hydrolase family 16 protein [Wenyingzhuangia sp. chi5]MDO3695166.1 glycoside hydrolase family 16 protein [Wenyingzhuangia sp. chi5]
MIKFRFSILSGICFFVLISCTLLNTNNIPKIEGYQLVWSDEFNVDGIPNQQNWSYEIGFVRNQENQWYQKENAFCKDGNLVIEARKENKINPNFISLDHKDWRKNRDSIHFSSSCIITKGKHAFKYGTFVMRAKIPTEMGLWPAFWTLGLEPNWPANGEIDIMEFYKGDVLANVAWEANQKWKPIWESKKYPLEQFKNKSWGEEFHIWKMDWDENSIKLYVDDQLLNQVDLKQTYNLTNQKNPFHKPQYLLLNLAVGGLNGGDISNTHFPAQYVIDYVRVYQKQE